MSQDVVAVPSLALHSAAHNQARRVDELENARLSVFALAGIDRFGSFFVLSPNETDNHGVVSSGTKLELFTQVCTFACLHASPVS